MAHSTQGTFVQGTAITSNDTTIFARFTNAIYIGGTGNINVRWGNTTANSVLSGVPAGTILPIRVDQVFATSTTATNIVLLY